MAWYDRIALRTYVLIAAAAVAIQIVSLHAMGRLAICKCGYVTLWHGVVMSPENSQQISDWFSLAHVVSGLLLYWLLVRMAPRLPVGLRLVLAVLIEVSWEILENTPFIMDRYRTYTLAVGYYGDTIVNSVADVIFCVLGFVLARRLSVRASVAMVVAMELSVAYWIRDNATLNTLMLIHPVAAIRQWQAGAGW